MSQLHDVCITATTPLVPRCPGPIDAHGMGTLSVILQARRTTALREGVQVLLSSATARRHAPRLWNKSFEAAGGGLGLLPLTSGFVSA